MKKYLWMFPLLTMIILMRCSEDSVEPVTRSKSTATDSVSVKQETPPTDTVAQADTATSTASAYPDSAFYRSAKFGDLPYRFIIPRKYDEHRRYPLVVFLHGIGERGTDNIQQLKWGSTLFSSETVSKSFPAFVVFPQCPANAMWMNEQVSKNVVDLVDALSRQYSIDSDRVYIVGISMGAYGTYSIVADHPGLFTAAVAISGDGNTTKAKEMASTHWRIFGGGKDVTVSSALSEKMFDALKAAGADAQIKIYPDADHIGSWVKAFAEPDFCAWLFSKKKN